MAAPTPDEIALERDMRPGPSVRELLKLFPNPIGPETSSLERWVALRRTDLLMARWNPIRYSRAELKEVMGHPTVESQKVIRYAFGGGLSGVVWEFGLHRDQVVCVRYIPLE